MVEIRPSRLIGLAATELRRRLYANDVFYGLDFDLTGIIAVPDVGVPLVVREIQESDIPLLLPMRRQNMNSGELRIRLERLMLLQAGIPACYVCVAPGEQPCGMCWLISSRSNRLLQRHFHGGIQELGAGEVLLENIYTRPDRRGGHIMGYLTLKLFEIASQQGATRAIAFIKAENQASLQGAQWIGWKLRFIKKVTWRLFFRRIAYSYDLSEHTVSVDDSHTP